MVPGVGVYATVPGGSRGPVDGTSFSAPEVTELAGLLSARGLTDDGGRRHIQSTATDLGADGGADGDDSLYGYGRIDAGAAVR